MSSAHTRWSSAEIIAEDVAQFVFDTSSSGGRRPDIGAAMASVPSNPRPQPRPRQRTSVISSASGHRAPPSAPHASAMMPQGPGTGQGELTGVPTSEGEQGYVPPNVLSSAAFPGQLPVLSAQPIPMHEAQENQFLPLLFSQQTGHIYAFKDSRYTPVTRQIAPALSMAMGTSTLTRPPAPIPIGPREAAQPKEYRALTIVMCCFTLLLLDLPALFFCVIPACIFSRLVDKAVLEGDNEKAKKFSTLTISCNVMAILLHLFFLAVVLAAAGILIAGIFIDYEGYFQFDL